MQLDSEITEEIISFFNKSIKAVKYPLYQGSAVMREIMPGDPILRWHPDRTNEPIIAMDGNKNVFSTSFILECFELSGGDTNWLNRFLMPAKE